MNKVSRKNRRKHGQSIPAQPTVPTVPAASSIPLTVGWLTATVHGWVDFWFRPVDPVGLHIVRVMAGVLFMTWLLPLYGQLEAFYGLEGWFDQSAYRDAMRLPEESRPALGWSILFLCGSNLLLLKATYVGALVVLLLFTLGIATRLTAIACWIVVVSFTANPVLENDADGMLVLLAFYLMIGYVLLHQSRSGQSSFTRWLGRRQPILPFDSAPQISLQNGGPSVAANVALRLLQVHLAGVIVVSGLHKLQFGDWWAGVALWYPLYPPLSATLADARTHMDHGVALLTTLSLAAYAVLAWQIAFPAFAWKLHWRCLLVGGACGGWLGSAWLYQLPGMGAVLFIGCLSYLTPGEWHHIASKLKLVTGLARRDG